MKELFIKLRETTESGSDAVLVTIVASSGSTPRGAGARMLITKEGHICGTIGGGAVEFRSEQLAQDVLKSGSSAMEHFRLHPNEVADIGMICGGNVDVYFHFIPAYDNETSALCRRIAELYSSGEQSWLITDITEASGGSLSVFGKKSGIFGAAVPTEVLDSLGSKPTQCLANEHSYYCEKLVQAGKVYIFGGGHVSQALVPALATVGFRCTVIEDRPEFAEKSLFPEAEETRVIEMSMLGELVPEITEDDFICVMTRGHKDDYEVQKYMLKTPACYIGVIGSRHKIAGVNAKLIADGYSESDLERITTPIGLEILSETPEEIAVSITAQLIMVRAKHTLNTRKAEGKNA